MKCGCTGWTLHRVNIALVWLLIGIPVYGRSLPTQTDHDLVPGTLYVKLVDRGDGASSSQRLEAVLKTHGIQHTSRSLWRQEFTNALRKRGRRSRSRSGIEHVQRELQRLHVCTFDPSRSPLAVAAEIASDPEVEYCEPRYLRHTCYIPNDFFYGQAGQNYFAEQHFPSAWDITQGSEDVVIAIVDSGVDYTHPELTNKLWTNPGEVADNGIDDDENGYVDDVKGWDFWERGEISSAVSDNDPIGEYSDHGTHVAGIAAAESDNGTGMTGTGFNCRYMAVKAGGTSNAPDEIGFGIEGILYAAMNGADIINCSWGGTTYSLAEEDIIDQVTAMGALVVCAAGNEDVETPIYPAGYANAMAVGSVDTGTGIRSDFSNFGIWLDVLATGNKIKSTSFNGSYVIKSGTSMATPVVSGLAGLIASQFPTWSPERIRSQIRATADDMDTNNLAFFSRKLGLGRIRADRAVAALLPALVPEFSAFSKDTPGTPFAGDTGTLDITITNEGDESTNAVISLISPDSDVTVLSGSSPTGLLPVAGSVTLSFNIQFGDAFAISTAPTLLVEMEDSSLEYRDRRVLEIQSLVAKTVTANDVTMTVTSTGSLGFVDALSGTGEDGFVTNTNSDSPHSILYEGGLILDLDGIIVDQVRSQDSISQDFLPLSDFSLTAPGTVSDVDGYGVFDSSAMPEAPRVIIEIESYAFAEESIDQCVFLKYTLTNPADYAIQNVYVGLYNDWDIGSAFQNSTAYDAQGQFLYTFDEETADMPYVAVIPLNTSSSELGIDNGWTGTVTDFDFGVYPTDDGFTDIEKYYSLRAGTSHSDRSQSDVSCVTACGPFSLVPSQGTIIGFVYAYGDTLQDLRDQAEAARQKSLFSVSPLSTTGLHNEAPTLEIVSPTSEYVVLNNGTEELVLLTAVSDDGHPDPDFVLTTTWSLIEGPEDPTFRTVSNQVTTATFPAQGTYTLRGTVSDGLLSAYQDIVVSVSPDGAPVDGYAAGWDFDSLTDNTFPDLSGNSRDATLQNGAQQTADGYADSALLLDGDSAVASFSSPSMDKLTVSAWVYSNSNGNSFFPRIVDMPGYLLYFGRDSSYDDTDDTLRFYADRTDGEGVWYSPPESIGDNEWTHVAVSYDSTTVGATPSLYINGEPVETNTLYEARGDNPVDNAGAGYIGNNGDGDRAWDGRIDEVHIFDRILTSTEIQSLAASPNANVAPIVDAGDDIETALMEGILLNGSATDDGKPAVPGALTLLWEQIDGPGTATFVNPESAVANVSFSQTGQYTLMLTADDGDIQTADAVTVNVIPTLSFASATGRTPEGSAPENLRLILNGSSIEDIGVAVSVSGTAEAGVDYSLESTELTIPAGAIFLDLPLTIVDDDTINEPDETIILEITGVTGAFLGEATHTHTIGDNDLVFTLALGNAQEGNLSFGFITGALDPPTDSFDTVVDAGNNPNLASVLLLNSSDGAGQDTLLTADVREAGTSWAKWRLVSDIPEGASNPILSWDFSGITLPAGTGIYLFHLKDDSLTGIPVNMLTETSHTLQASGELAIVYGPASTHILDGNSTGWHLVGTPVFTASSFREIVGDRLPDGAKIAWSWDGRAYVPFDLALSPIPERAYWIYLNAGTPPAYSGVADDGIIILSSGWHLVSPVADIPYPDSLPTDADVWSWDAAGRTYKILKPSDNLQAQQGYWIFTHQDNTPISLAPTDE